MQEGFCNRSRHKIDKEIALVRILQYQKSSFYLKITKILMTELFLIVRDVLRCVANGWSIYER